MIYVYISEWLWADYLLYDHFKQKFIKERESYGLSQLNHEKEILKRATEHVKQRCIEAQVDNNLLPQKDRLYGSNVMGYKLKENSGDSSCPYYTMKEVSFLDEVRKIQEQKSMDLLRSDNMGNPNNKSSEKSESQLSHSDALDPIWMNPNDLDIQELRQRFKFKKFS